MENITTDTAQVKQYIEALWPMQEAGFLGVSTKGNGRLVTKFFGHPVNVDRLCSVVDGWSDQDVWVCQGCLRKRPEKGRGTAEDVIANSALWFDLDVKEGHHNKAKLPSKDDALSILQEIPFKPSMLIWSGGGYQPYWLFKEPLEDVEQFKKLSERFHKKILSILKSKGFDGDNTCDPVRLLRLPGTWNHKGDPVKVRILEVNDYRYEPENFEDFAVDVEDEQKEQPAGPGLGSLESLTFSIKQLIKNGAPKGERSEATASVIVAMLKARVPEDAIISVFDKEAVGEKYREKGSGRVKWLRDEISRCRGFVRSQSRVDEKNEQTEAMLQARNDFPRGPFPWEVLSSTIAESLKQLARSCASSPTSLPGAAMAIFASLIGSTVSVSPKRSWIEPLIFWFADIRGSGEGKTHPARALCQVLYDAQTQADMEYKAALEAWNAADKRSRGEPPARARGYFGTDLTLEGLRDDHSGHGGKVIILDELSAFISSQNQYKKKGADREAWLCLHDGKAARIIRVGKSYTIRGARVSIFGGIQPQVWKVAFSGEKIYLVDGTVYRVLPVYEGPAFHPLTAEAWDDDNRVAWEKLLRSAMNWADSQWVGIQGGTKKAKALCLSAGAQERFLDWRNELMQVKDDLPGPVRGFIPKLVGYALRFSGVLYLMDIFSRNEDPGVILNDEHVRKGIKVSEFYLGHIIAAMEALVSENAPEPFETTDQTIELAKSLEGLKAELDNGRLAIGYIQEKFDAAVERGLRVHNSRGMGSLLRKCGLTISGGRYRANGKTGVYCLVWDQKTDSFVGSMSTSPSSPQIRSISGFEVMEEESPQVHQVHHTDQARDEMMDMMEEKKPKSTGQEPHYQRVCGHDEHDGGVFGSANEMQPPEMVEI